MQWGKYATILLATVIFGYSFNRIIGHTRAEQAKTLKVAEEQIGKRYVPSLEHIFNVYERDKARALEIGLEKSSWQEIYNYAGTEYLKSKSIINEENSNYLDAYGHACNAMNAIDSLIELQVNSQEK